MLSSTPIVRRGGSRAILDLFFAIGELLARYCFQLLTSSQKAVESVKCPRLAKDCTLVEAVWYSLYDIDAVTAELIAFWSDE